MMEPLRKSAETPTRDSALLKLVARREHNLSALMELCQHLARTDELYGIVDTALLNIMGHVGARRGAIWLASPSSPNSLVLVRTKGVSHRRVRALTAVAGGPVWERVRTKGAPVQVEELMLSEEANRLVADGGFAMFLPIEAGHEFLGLVGLGHRVDDGNYGQLDLQVLRSTAGILGIMVQNSRARQHLAESNRQLKHAQIEQAHLDDIKTRFLRNVHHELRTPLTGIMGGAELLANLETSPTAKALVEGIQGSAARLSKLIGSLLDLASVEDAAYVPDCQVIDVRQFLAAWGEARVPGVGLGLRELCLRIPSGEILAFCDKWGLSTILDTLVDNACKFTPEGTQIVVTLSPESMVGSPARITIEDDGPGIPADRLDSIFEPFEQADNSLTRPFEGLGIGLAVAQGMARRMNCSLTVSSTVGHGTTFMLSLPTRSMSNA